MGIRLMRLRPGVGQAGLYSQPEQKIYLADDLYNHTPLYGWVLAHEMSHAADPRFAVLGGYEYGQDGMSHKTNDYELIAEVSAKAAFESFGLRLSGCEHHLESLAGKRWANRLRKPEFDRRLLAASGALKKPLPQGTREQQREHRRVWDRIRTAEYVAIKDAEEDLRYYENPWGAFKTAKKVYDRFRI